MRLPSHAFFVGSTIDGVGHSLLLHSFIWEPSERENLRDLSDCVILFLRFIIWVEIFIKVTDTLGVSLYCDYLILGLRDPKYCINQL